MKTIQIKNGFDQQDFEFKTYVERRTFRYLLVVYRYQPEFIFQVQIPINKVAVSENRMDYEFRGVRRPGEITGEENFLYFGIEDLNFGFSNWMDNISEELRSVPVRREIEKQGKVLEEILGRLTDIPDEYFTREEAEDYRSRLDELERRFSEKLRNDAESNGHLEAQIENLRQDVEVLKSKLELLKKPGWMKAMAVRVTSWMSDKDNQKLLKTGADIAKILLPEAIK